MCTQKIVLHVISTQKMALVLIDKHPQDSTGLDGLHESGMGLTKAVWDLMVLIKAWDLMAFY